MEGILGLGPLEKSVRGICPSRYLGDSREHAVCLLNTQNILASICIDILYLSHLKERSSS